MRTDAIIIGSELDGLLAGARLCELGHSIRVLSSGAGSLNYCSDGIRALGYLPGDADVRVISPLDAISNLHREHPYQKIGKQRVAGALRWFAKFVGEIHQPFTSNGRNTVAVSPAGLELPVYCTSSHQATIEKLEKKRVGVVTFRGHRDFPAELIAVERSKTGQRIRLISCDPPAGVVENAALAKSFDALRETDSYFTRVRDSLPTDIEVVLFPAVMGFLGHHDVLASAERVLGVPCLEVPTLPPSVPGMRLEHVLTRHLMDNTVTIHIGAGISRSSLDGAGYVCIWDNMGRKFEASVVIVSSGGILMGGLDVDSHGVIHETSLGLDTFQSEPLKTVAVGQSLDALHAAGVEIDCELRPQSNGSMVAPNVFVTGRTLAHWNPAAESSAEGVSIATGWVAAENAHHYIEALRNE